MKPKLIFIGWDECREFTKEQFDYLLSRIHMTTKHKITPEQKQAVADLLGITIDKIPEEVDWDDNDNDDEDEEETEEDLEEEGEDDDEDDETLEDDEDEEDVDDEDDEDANSSDVDKMERALEEYQKGPKDIPFSDFLKQRGL
jgi:hypothetical protein